MRDVAGCAPSSDFYGELTQNVVALEFKVMQCEELHVLLGTCKGEL